MNTTTYTDQRRAGVLGSIARRTARFGQAMFCISAKSTAMSDLAALADAGLVDLVITDSGHRDWGSIHTPPFDWPRPEAEAVLYRVSATVTDLGVEALEPVYRQAYERELTG